MNLPNKLTIMRVVMIPFFVVFFMIAAYGGAIGHVGEGYGPITAGFVGATGGIEPGAALITALILFCVASLTDFLDGYIARKYNLVSDFGKLMDPLADKLLVTSALILLSWAGRLPAVVTLIIISREFVVSGLRQIAVEKGVVIAAGPLGKIKTVFQMIFIILMLTGAASLSFIADICMWIALIMTLVSMVDYIYRNRKLITA